MKDYEDLAMILSRVMAEHKAEIMLRTYNEHSLSKTPARIGYNNNYDESDEAFDILYAGIQN